MYIGIDGIARKVKKAYIGIADKARLWFSGIRYIFTVGKLHSVYMIPVVILILRLVRLINIAILLVLQAKMVI